MLIVGVVRWGLGASVSEFLVVMCSNLSSSFRLSEETFELSPGLAKASCTVETAKSL